MQALFVLALLLAVVVLLVTEKLRPDVVAMLALAVIMVSRILTTQEALSGFSNPATVTVACMFVLSAGLQTSGLVPYLGDRLLRNGPFREGVIVLLCALVIGPASAFINNTAVVAVFLPVALRACHRSGVSPSRVLMPLSFFAMLGGMVTLVGTSTNILVSSMAEARGIAPFGMFEFAPPGVLLFAAGTVYLLTLGRRWLPERVRAESLTEQFHLNRYLSEVVVLPGSPLAGRSLARARLGERFDLEVLMILRGERRMLPRDELKLAEGDLLLVKAPASALVQLRDRAGIGIRPGRHPDDADLRSADSVLLEAIVASNSPLEGRTLKGVDFRHRYGATALAIRRHGEDIREKIGRVRLRVGDELLILAPRAALGRLRDQNDFVILEEMEVPRVQPVRALAAGAIVAGVVGVAATGLMPVAEAAVIGAVLMVVTGCLPARRVYRDVDWQVVFLLAGIIPLGLALERSGAAEQAVRILLALTQGWTPELVLSLFFFVAMALTGFMSNNAAAALLAPLAITCARELSVNPRPFLIALTFAASAAFYTPVGYQTNLLVYGPGGYKFADFVRVGGPLNVIVWLAAAVLIPFFFPF